ncbi:MAG: excinuclease ABC subunit UvrA [Mycoplasmataceae bacterium]|nr:excinuclease ABC subunit UvrA [Mycoplasmataceae bacterium]
MLKDEIEIIKASEHNLKDVSLKIPKNKLIVITGVSGSGKSSLAFDVIYSEGRRKYIESLSAYARQFLGNGKIANVEKISGLSPTIAIDQKTTSHNPRSTVGTVTEIYDYIRVLWSRVGTPFCPNHNIPITPKTTKQITDIILNNEAGTKINILSPVIREEKGTHAETIERLIKDGYVRAKINGKIVLLDDEIKLEKNKKHSISIVVDRLTTDDSKKDRISEAIDACAEYSGGLVLVEEIDTGKETLHSKNFACKYGDFSIPELEPRLFSYNSPIGYCDKCKGIGYSQKVSWDLLVPNDSLSIKDGGIEYYKNAVDSLNIEWQLFKKALEHYDISLTKPLKQFTEFEKNIVMRGSDESIDYDLKTSSGNSWTWNKEFEGVANIIERRHIETKVERRRKWYAKFMNEQVCNKCNGKKLKIEALSVKIGDLDIIEFTNLSISKAINFIKDVSLNDQQKEIAELVLKEVKSRLFFLSDVGLDYLTLSRSSSTLSGGESQRIRLATQMGSSLSGVIYVLDEPSIGLHQRDNDKLILTLKGMQELGNTVIVVEHDYETMMASDHIVDIGPRAGIYGGTVVAQGTPQEIMKNEKSLTGKYLSGELKIDTPKKRRNGKGNYLSFVVKDLNNIKNQEFKIPLNVVTSITGVSGSGKSTMMNESLYKIIKSKIDPLNNPIDTTKIGKLKGFENIDKVVRISQDPIGRTPRSNPATYTGAFDLIREIFAYAPDSKIKGFTKSRFSFNVPGGRCEKCSGDGELKISMNFLPDVYVKCDECQGKRYNDETLSIKFKGKSIFDVLELSIDEALEFFDSFPKLKNKLQYLVDVGLGYLKVGHPATLLSGGEAQRIKLATYLEKRATGKTIYLLDEPTTGLHVDDIRKLIDVINRIVDSGDTVVIIEHNMDIIKISDWVIDMGPGGGEFGGKVVAAGTPEKVITSTKSVTAPYLEKSMK